ncbi:MAG: hypothetical protein KGY99_06075 [Phycisphaerae bacterium]|nr:hypothetical protein [Phycisphaerae bacterium]
MTEHYPTDAELDALSGTTDAEQEVLFVPTGESPYYTSFYKMLYRLLDVARRAGDLRVYKDGALTFGVRAGRFMSGTTAVDFAGAAEQPLTDNATNAVYLTADGTLTVTTDGFPDPQSVPHLPLATITCADGDCAHADIVDYRGRALLRACTGLSGDNANAAAAFFAATDLTGPEAETLSDGSVADTLHAHDTAGLAAGAVTADKLAAAATQTITADDQTIQHNNRSVVLLTLQSGSDYVLDADPAIADGAVDGQELTLLLTTPNGQEITVADGVNTSLAGDWYTNRGGGWLHLRWDGDTWCEVGRGHRTNTCSGKNAVALGTYQATNSGAFSGSLAGHTPTNSAPYTGSVGGYACTNSAAYAGSVGGVGGTCRHQAEALAAAYRREAPGDAQVTNYLLRGDFTCDANEHTGPSWHELDEPQEWTLEANTVVGFTVTIVGELSDGSKAAMYKRMILLKRDGANNTTQIGATQTIGTDIESDANWDVRITPNSNAGHESLKVEVHCADADSGSTAYWTAHTMPQVVA